MSLSALWKGTPVTFVVVLTIQMYPLRAILNIRINYMVKTLYSILSSIFRMLLSLSKLKLMVFLYIIIIRLPLKICFVLYHNFEFNILIYQWFYFVCSELQWWILLWFPPCPANNAVISECKIKFNAVNYWISVSGLSGLLIKEGLTFPSQCQTHQQQQNAMECVWRKWWSCSLKFGLTLPNFWFKALPVLYMYLNANPFKREHTKHAL